MNLSPHFTLDEMTHSDIAIAKGIDNTPPPAAIECAKQMCLYILEPTRSQFGAMRVNSGYRSPALSAAVNPNTAGTSQHIWSDEDCACDIWPLHANIREVYKWMAASDLPFDQLILEYNQAEPPEPRCIHVSYRLFSNRGLTLIGKTYGKGKYEHYIGQELA